MDKLKRDYAGEADFLREAHALVRAWEQHKCQCRRFYETAHPQANRARSSIQRAHGLAPHNFCNIILVGETDNRIRQSNAELWDGSTTVRAPSSSARRNELVAKSRFCCGKVIS